MSSSSFDERNVGCDVLRQETSEMWERLITREGSLMFPVPPKEDSSYMFSWPWYVQSGVPHLAETRTRT